MKVNLDAFYILIDDYTNKPGKFCTNIKFIDKLMKNWGVTPPTPPPASFAPDQTKAIDLNTNALCEIK